MTDRSINQMHLLPPAPGLCQECAVDHDPGQPHNAQSFYYQWVFSLAHQRSPTWADAMAHCSDEVKASWAQQLSAIGVDVDSTNLTGEIQSAADLEDRLNQLQPKNAPNNTDVPLE